MIKNKLTPPKPRKSRYCSECKGIMPAVGGTWIISKDGLTRRWVCALHAGHDTEALKEILSAV